MFNPHEYGQKYYKRSELNYIYLSLGLRTFALTLIALFIPLYLRVEQGLSLNETLSFYLFYSVVIALTTPVAAKFASKWGVKHTILFSMPFYLGFIALLYLFPYYNVSLLFPAGFAGIAIGFYWMGMHILFHHVSDKKHRGEECGKRRTFMILGALLGPIIGGLLISYVGFKLVFLLAGIVLFLSGGVLFMNQENHVKYYFSMRRIVNKDHWKNSLYFASRGSGAMAIGVIWPLFIFGILGDYLTLGLVGSALSFFNAIAAWFTGRFSDHTSKRTIIRGAAIFNSLAWFLKSLVITVGHVFSVTILGAIAGGIWIAPASAMEYDKAKGDIVGYFVSREIFISLGKILMLVIVMMLGNLKGGLIFQGFATFASFLF